jgi:hypothetical protein
MVGRWTAAGASATRLRRVAGSGAAVVAAVGTLPVGRLQVQSLADAEHDVSVGVGVDGARGWTDSRIGARALARRRQAPGTLTLGRGTATTRSGGDVACAGGAAVRPGGCPGLRDDQALLGVERATGVLDSRSTALGSGVADPGEVRQDQHRGARAPGGEREGDTPS